VATDKAAAAKAAADKAAADKAAAEKAAAAKAAADKAAADKAAADKAAAAKAAADKAASDKAAAQAAADQANQISGFVAAIQRQVQARWRKPLNWPAGMRCELRVKLLPSGEVISAQAVDCGNDPAFVESVQDAVMAASPLKVPSDIGLFNAHFRNFIFEFKADAS
jgi:colicin import membrane protein